jgi:hypothetical protein
MRARLTRRTTNKDVLGIKIDGLVDKQEAASMQAVSLRAESQCVTSGGGVDGNTEKGSGCARYLCAGRGEKLQGELVSVL